MIVHGISISSAREFTEEMRKKGTVGIIDYRPFDSALAAWESGRCAGIVTFSREPRPWLVGVFVWPEFRGQGFGKALVAEAVEILRGEGAKKIVAEPCSADGWHLVEALPQETQAALELRDAWD